MADYCKQCSETIFGEDFKELAGLRDEKMKAAGRYPIVLCEGCGPIQVDENGVCQSQDCLENHNQGKRNVGP